jgi:hypothetical protein
MRESSRIRFLRGHQAAIKIGFSCSTPTPRLTAFQSFSSSAESAERLIGLIRRDCIDHVIVFGKRHLRHVLRSYVDLSSTRALISGQGHTDLARHKARWPRIRPASLGWIASPIWANLISDKHTQTGNRRRNCRSLETTGENRNAAMLVSRLAPRANATLGPAHRK